MVLPATQHPAVHHADEDCERDAALYWVRFLLSLSVGSEREQRGGRE